MSKTDHNRGAQMDEQKIADLLKQKAEKMKTAPSIQSALEHFEKAHKSLKKGRDIVISTTDHRKKILYQHLIMAIGFVEGIIQNFEKYTTEAQTPNQLDNIEPDNIITYIKETNLDAIKKFPDTWNKS